MECRRCRRQVDGTLYAHWERECKTCQAFMRLQEDNLRLQREKNQPVEHGGWWPIEDTKSIAEIENTELSEELAAFTAERDQLRAEVEDIRQQLDYWQEEAVEMRRYKEASESLVAGLRGVLEEAGDVVHACFCETEEIRGKVCHPSCIAINTALTITPASAGNRTDEETEAANGR